MGLRGLQERQSHGQLSSAFLEGLDKLTCAEYTPCRLKRNNENPWVQTGAVMSLLFICLGQVVWVRLLLFLMSGRDGG